jgi:uncharacterized protein VirK/YbjX
MNRTDVSVTGELFRLVRRMHPELDLRGLKKHVELLLTGMFNYGEIRRWFAIADSPGLAQARERFPLISGAIFWPYINRTWKRGRKLEVIDRHYRMLDGPAAIVADAMRDEVVLATLDDEYEGLKLVLDKAIWFLREGEAVLNLFLDRERIYSAAFSLGEEGGRRLIYLGALQGSNSDAAQDTYRHMTRKLHGLRPRDLLMTSLKLLCIEMGIGVIWAVRSEDRQHNSAYFAGTHDEKVLVRYDEVWQEHGGTELANGFFEIPATVKYRDAGEIPTHKRAMYRRRYQMLNRLAMEIEAACIRHAAAHH